MGRQTCFVITPFSPPFDSNYENILKPTIARCGLTPIRGDEIFTTGAIMEDVWRNIATCRLLVAELSGKNPNVYYELGIAHTLDKPVILLVQKGEELPFDVSAIRAIVYDTAHPDWRMQLGTLLEKTIVKVLEASKEERPYWKTYRTRKEKALSSLPPLHLEKTEEAFKRTIGGLSESQRLLFREILSCGSQGIYFYDLRKRFPDQSQGELAYRCRELDFLGLLSTKIGTDILVFVPGEIISLAKNVDLDNVPVIKGRRP